MKVGLVLGAGGVLGGAWLTGALEALADETGWDPRDADYLVGTSAGAVLAALLAGGVPPHVMVAHSQRRDVDPSAADPRAGRRAGGSGAAFRLHRGWPALGPGSWSLVGRTLTAPRRHRPAALAAGWLPRGVLSTEPIKDLIRRVVPNGWAEHERLWIVACDYTDGHRVAFGRDGAPAAELADAVAASCAIPAVYRPVEISGRSYVDGGLWSTSNLDILRREELDLVICLNPTSSLHSSRGRTPVDRLAAFTRSLSGRRLGSEARTLRAEGTAVALIQPRADDLAVMGANLMSRGRRGAVLDTALETVREQLRETGMRDLLQGLEAGYKTPSVG